MVKLINKYTTAQYAEYQKALKLETLETADFVTLTTENQDRLKYFK